MNIKTIILLSMAAISTPLVAMPTKQDIDKVSAVVQDLMRPEQEAMNAGRKTRTEVAQVAVSLAEQADSEAAKLLLLKGAFNLYVRDGAFDEAVGTLKTLKETIPDMPPQIVANLIESSLRSVSKKNGGQLYRLLDETRTYVRYQNELKTDLARSAKEPANRMLHLRIAEKYAVLGNWTKALEEFTKGSDRKAADIAQAERGEKTDLTKKAIADFWWDYPQRKGEEIQKAFKLHAAAIYEEAIASGDISGLVKIQAERRIEEAKEFGELPAQESSLLAATTTKLRLASGVDLELIKCPAGEFTMGYECWQKFGSPFNRESRKTHQVKITKDFMLGKFPVTCAQWYVVMGKGRKLPKELANMPIGNITVPEMEAFCEKLTARFKGTLGKKVFRLPTEAEWEYASKGGKNLEGMLGNDWGPGDKGKYDAIFTKLGYRSEDHERVSSPNDQFYAWKALPVGKFDANEWGFQDLIGNIREVTADMVLDQSIPGDWRWDKIGDYLHPWNAEQHYSSIEVDPLRKGHRHVVRGGFWVQSLTGPSSKLTIDRTCKLPSLGFRVCVGEKLGDWNNATASKSTESKPTDFTETKKVMATFKTGVKPGTITTLKIADGCDIEFAYCPEGKMNILFKKPEMFAKPSDSNSFRRQNISHGYWLSRSPITVLQWKELMGEDLRSSNDKGIATGISDVAMKKYLDVLNRRHASKLPIGYEFRFPTSAEYTQAQAAMQDNRDNPYWPVDDNPADWKSAKVVPDTPNPWGLVMLGSFGCMLYDTTDCKEDDFKSKEATDNGRLTAFGGRPWYAFEEKLPLKDPVLITKNGHHLMSGFRSEVYRKSCFVAPNDKAALRVCIGRKIK